MAAEGEVKVGDRVRVVKDQKTADGRVYLRKGATGIVEEIADRADLQPDEVPIGVRFEGLVHDFVDFEDIEVVTAAADVAKEPRTFFVTGTVKVEVTARITAMTRADAEAQFKANGFDVLSDNDEMGIQKIKVQQIVDEREW